MQNITDFIFEAMGILNDDDVVKMGDTHLLIKYLKSKLEEAGIGEPQKLTCNGNCVLYNKSEIPNTKIAQGLTAGELADITIEWIENYLGKRAAADAKGGRHIKLRKNYGEPRGNYGEAERRKEREFARNRAIIGGQDY